MAKLCGPPEPSLTRWIVPPWAIVISLVLQAIPGDGELDGLSGFAPFAGLGVFGGGVISWRRGRWLRVGAVVYFNGVVVHLIPVDVLNHENEFFDLLVVEFAAVILTP